MKLKILAVNCLANRKGIVALDFYQSPSFSDYDALIIDPQNISEDWTEKIGANKEGVLWTYKGLDGGYGAALLGIMSQRSEEILLLLEKTGGIVICFFRDRGVVLNYHSGSGSSNKEISRYGWIPPVWGKEGYKLSPYFKCKRRVGKEFGEINKAHPFSQYLIVLKDNLTFEAVIEDISMLEYSTVIGKNKVGEIIALEIPIGIGKFIFIPPFDSSAETEKITGILIDCIRKSLQWSKPLVRPDWLNRYTLPSEEDLLKKLEEIDGESKRINQRKENIDKDINKIECLKGLLYETGKYALESSVREAFRIIGFSVKEPTEYNEPYDLFGVEGDINIIGEVEGSKGQIDVGKARQLLDYVTNAISDGKKCKGILIGNGFIDILPQERKEQFTDQVIRICDNQKYCRMTTTELYKSIEAILSNPSNQELKESAKKKILDCESEFRFDG